MTAPNQDPTLNRTLLDHLSNLRDTVEADLVYQRRLEHEVQELQSETARHHELIEWMRDSLYWALNRSIWFPGSDGEREQEILQRLKREVS